MPDGEKNYRFHPYAEIFPLMEGKEFDELVEDIREKGLMFPIIRYNGQILDGRNRYRACLKAGAQLKFADYPGNDPLNVVITANLKRRHLNESQRALAASKIATLSVGRPRKGQTGPKIADAARIFNVGERTIKNANIVQKHGQPEIVARVARGDLSLDIASKIARLPVEDQRRLADEAPRVLVGAVKRIARETRLEALRTPIAVAAAELENPQQLFSVLLCDPPWRFEPRSRETGMDRAADNHYPTMTTDKICAVNIPAAKDAVLFLWATQPMLDDALWVMREWGFKYRSHMVWLKSRIGTGYWFRNQHELLLVGTKGDIPAPLPGTQYNSVHSADTGKHSEKPSKFYEIIEDMFPRVAHCELFAREPRLGWSSWGAELIRRESTDESQMSSEVQAEP